MIKSQYPSNLSTVVESAYSKQHNHVGGIGKICPVCAKKQRLGQSQNAGVVPRGGSGVKGAPYYQAMSL